MVIACEGADVENSRSAGRGVIWMGSANGACVILDSDTDEMGRVEGCVWGCAPSGEQRGV